MVGCEALAWWRSSEFHEIQADEFLFIAEASDAMAHLVASLDQAKKLRAVILNSGFDPARLVVENTETAMLHDAKVTAAAFTLFRKLGVRIALDEFGTANSSLIHLQDSEIDRSKVDVSLTRKLEADEATRGILQLCASIKVECVVVGGANVRHFQVLDEMLVPLAQGYHCGHSADGC